VLVFPVLREKGDRMLSPHLLDIITAALKEKGDGDITKTTGSGQTIRIYRGKGAAQRALEAFKETDVAISGIEEVAQDTYCFIA
jgi:hypothetical protein